MALPNVEFTIDSNNLGRLEPDADNVGGLILGTIDGLAELPDGSETVIFSLEQAENLGLNKLYDANYDILAWFHAKEFFRKNPNGELHLLTKDAPLTIDDVFNVSTGAALDFIRNANGRIKQLGVVLNNPSEHSAFMTNIATHLAQVQAFCNKMNAEYKWLDVVFIEGLGFDIASGSLPDLRAVDNPNLGVLVGTDNTVFGSDADYEGTAAIGTLLGSSTNKPIHESFAEAKPENTITSEADSMFLDVRIKKTLPDTYKNNPTDQEQLYKKGFIFPRKYPLQSGFYWVQSSNCSLNTSDLSSIEMVQVINKAQRVLYATLVKYINRTFNITDQGRLAYLDRKLVEADVRTSLDANMSNNYSELVAVIVDPAKDENNAAYPSIQVDNTLRVFVGIRAKGKTIYIKVNVGFVK